MCLLFLSSCEVLAVAGGAMNSLIGAYVLRGFFFPQSTCEERHLENWVINLLSPECNIVEIHYRNH